MILKKRWKNNSGVENVVLKLSVYTAFNTCFDLYCTWFYTQWIRMKMRAVCFAPSLFPHYLPLLNGSSRAWPNGGSLDLKVVARPVSLQESGLACQTTLRAKNRCWLTGSSISHLTVQAKQAGRRHRTSVSLAQTAGQDPNVSMLFNPSWPSSTKHIMVNKVVWSSLLSVPCHH